MTSLTLPNPMLRRERGRTESPGFTLVELLVAIAIIAILSALVFSGVMSARNKAHQAYCFNNLRQLGVATMTYCNDNNGDLPFAWDRTNPDASENNFFAQLKPILYSAKFDGYFDFESGVFACRIAQ